jgi:hypothetical protein
MNHDETTRIVSTARSPAAWEQLANEFRPYVELCTGDFNDHYLPAHVEWYLQRCRIRSHTPFDFLNVPATDENLLRHNTKDYYLSPESEAVRGGERDLERVPFYVHVAPIDGRVVELQYYFFYPYNGPVPLLCNSFLEFDGIGAHEGDWEGVRLRVDVDAGAILEVYFATHGDQGVPLRHPTEGQGDPAHYRVIGKRPVVYAAYHSHASYPDLGKHKRLKGGTCDRCTGGRLWDGPAVVVSIDPELLPAGVTYEEPTWLNWKGRWGSTVQVPNGGPVEWDSWTSNSPDGPKISDSWTPGRGKGTWGVWAPVAPEVALPLGEYFTLSSGTLGTWPLIGCVENGGDPGVDNVVWIAHRSPNWQFSRVGAVPSETDIQLVRFAVADDSLVMAFAQNLDGRLYWTTQSTDGAFDRWGEWTPLAGAELRATQGAFVVNTDDDGLVHVLVPCDDGTLYDIVQESGSSQSGWRPPAVVVSWPGAGSGSVATTHRDDGTLVAVYSFAGRTAYLSWSSQRGWDSNGGELPQRNSGFMVRSLTRNAYGVLYVFAIEKSEPVGWQPRYSHEQTPGQVGNWSPWESIPGAPHVGVLWALPEANGRIAVIAQAPVGSVMMARQEKEGGGWTAWSEVGQPISNLGEPFQNADGRLEAVATVWSNADRDVWLLYNNYESSPYY